MADRISIDPGNVAKDGAEMGQLADEVRAIFRWFKDSADALGKPWGEGDDVAESFEKNYVPSREQFDLFFETLAKSFDQTAEGVIEMAQGYQSDDDFGVESANNLLGGGAEGGAPGGGRF